MNSKNIILIFLAIVGILYLVYRIDLEQSKNQHLQLELQKTQLSIDSLQRDRKIFEDKILSDEKNLKKLYDKLKTVSSDSLTLNDAKQILGL